MAEYLPASQSVQAEAPVAEYVPAEHWSLHATARPVEDEYVPASHAVQLDEPVLIW